MGIADASIATAATSHPASPPVGPTAAEELPGEGPRSAGPPRRELKAFTGLTGVQVFQVVSGLITAPLIARALGAEQRGLLAAIVVPLAVGGYIFSLGLGPFAVNRLAQGGRVNAVFSSLALPMILVGCITAALSPLIAGGLSQGRPPVDHFLTIGFALMPISLLISLSMSAAMGLALWRVVSIARLLSPLIVCVGVVVLSGLDQLTLEGAAALTIVSGIVPIAAFGSVLRRALPPRVDLRLVREGLSFGGRAWVGLVANMANQRLDQFLMIPLVSPRQLGLYTVAVTIASLCTVLTSQMVTVVLPRIAAGESHLLSRATRCVLAVAVGTGAVIALLTQLLLIPLFGSDFADARALVYVLLLGWIFQAGLGALSLGLPAVGRPGAPSVGEVVSLAITIPGLVVLLPRMGAMGAALITVVAYATTFAVLLAITTRHLGDRPIDYLLPRPVELARLSRLARSYLIGALRGRLAPR